MSEYKIKILTIQTQIFKILIDSLKDVVKDVNLSFDKKGISLITTNQINSLLIKMRIKKESLEFYECKIKDNEKYVASHVKTALRDNSMFIAFAPVENPKIAIAIAVQNNPNAAEVARRVIDYYLLTILKEENTEETASSKS